MPAIRARDLRKDYGDIHAVDGVSFDVEHGEIFALLGHNGAGKTTTVEILEGHRPRTSGEVTVLDQDPGSADPGFRDRIGIVLQSSGVEHELTVREAVDIYSSCYSRRRGVADVVDIVGLSEQLDRRVGHLSGGQRRRLDLAMGIAGQPDLLFLDEPTTGFDPTARRHAWELIRELRTAGTTMLLTTHYLEEAEHLADRVGVLSAGRLVAEGTPDELIGRAGTTVIRFQLPDGVTAGELPLEARAAGQDVELPSADATRDLHTLTGWALDRGVELQALSVSRPSLEDVFLGLADQTGTA
jgi:ABC-2 type transport system ATP-binding protein